MEIKNNLANVEKKPKFSVVINEPAFQKAIRNTLQSPALCRAFTANLITAVTINPSLEKCTAPSLIAGALQAESYKLPIGSLGYTYLIPYEDKKNKCFVAQFQIGYKGLIQLAIRSGQYKSINVCEVRKGEIKRWNHLTGELELNTDIDYDSVLNDEIVGYFAFFETINGFRKEIFMTKEYMMNYADTYSMAFSKEKYQDYITGNYDKNEAYKYSSFWYKNFDEMAKKTCLKQLFSKWGILSVEMQNAIEKDQAVINDDGTFNYVDNNGENQESTIIDSKPNVVEENNEEEERGLL